MDHINIHENERDPIPCCRHCEHATVIASDEHFVFCSLRQQDTSYDGVCASYIYNLLSREPLSMPSFSHLDLSGLAEANDL